MNDTILDGAVSSSTVGFNETIKGFLTSIGKWTKFFSILGFIGMGLMILGAMGLFAAGSFMSGGDSRFGGGMVGPSQTIFAVVYLILAVLYYFPVMYLYKFSTNLKSALDSNDQYEYELAFENLKKHYGFVGIMTIVVLSIYALILLFAMIGIAAN